MWRGRSGGQADKRRRALLAGWGRIPLLLPPPLQPPPPPPPHRTPRSEPARYAGTLRRLAADPAWRSALGLENRARAVAEFSLELMVSRWKRLYLEASGMTPPPEQQHEHVP